MYYMKILNRLTLITPIFLSFSLLGGQPLIENKSNLDLPQESGHFEYSILKPSKFQMNHGFTLMTSMNSGINQTTGIYSNFSSYKLSERLQINTGIHLIQNQNNLSFPSGPQTDLGYKFGLEYKLSPNSLITLHVINYNNSSIHNHNLSPFNVP